MFIWVKKNLERLTIFGFGLVFFGFAVHNLWAGSLPDASAAFGMGFLCALYSSVARFKRFKGFGFEAELWEDKQREAEELIERLKGIVAIYSREIVLARVTQDRMDSGRGSWKERWKLFDEVTRGHEALGQKIDFSGLKAEVDTYFILDMAARLKEEIRMPILAGVTEAEGKIRAEFGAVVSDVERHSRKQAQLREVKTEQRGLFEVANNANVAERLLRWAQESQNALRSNFGVEITFDQDTLRKLREVSAAYQSRPVEVTGYLISLADGT